MYYMGFTATSAPLTQDMEGHAVFSWSFSNELTIARPASTPRSKSKVYLALALATVVLILIVMVLLVFLASRRRQRKRAYATGRIESALQTARAFTYKELYKATNGFDEKRKVGEGGYGGVYKGILSDGSVVAVKKLRHSLMLEDQFYAEASIIIKVRHRYLIELKGWCYVKDGKEALLVSQYMSKGSLDRYLFDASKKKLLGNFAMEQTKTRIRILKQMAEALEYLHGGLGECVLHRDVKAANVLLADNDNDHEKQELEARLCDFGHKITRRVTCKVHGTLEITNFNSSIIVKKCSVCKGRKVNKLGDAGYCFDCSKPVEIVEAAALEGIITTASGVPIEVTLAGDSVDKVLQLDDTLVNLYNKNIVITKVMLSEIVKVGSFLIDNQGCVIGFSPSASSTVV